MKVKKGTEKTLKEVLLNHLGVKDTDEINGWFKKSYADEYRIDRFDKAKYIIDRFKNKEIHIIGDYDVDGVTATSIMYMGLKLYGCQKVFYRTPRRFSEGFGLNIKMIDEITDTDSLIITVDNGIAAVDAIKAAKERGFTVIITDHHLASVDSEGNPVYPEADLLIDPSAMPETADYAGYCGAGIAYKLIRYLIGEQARPYFEPIAAIGTIADVMELREENYVIVKNGLSGLGKSLNPGISALLRRLGNPERVSADFIGFQVAPCLNAPGRLLDDGSMKSVELITTENKNDAERLAEFIYNQNVERKQQMDKAVRTAEDIIEKAKMTADIPIVINIPDVNEGIIGIIAGRIMDRYNRPAIVFTNVKDTNNLKGSGRSPKEDFNIKNVLDKAQKHILKYGGHAGAAGITIEEKALNDFRKAVQEAASEEPYKPGITADITYDIEVPMSEVESAAEMIEQFSPHGMGNKKIIVKIPDFVNIPKNSQYKTLIAKEGIKLFGEGLTAINFHAVQDFKDIEKPEKLVLYGELSFNYYKGSRTVQMSFVDFDLISEINDKPNNTPFADLLATMAAMQH